MSGPWREKATISETAVYNLCEQLGYKCFFIKETNSAELEAFKQVRSSHQV